MKKARNSLILVLLLVFAFSIPVYAAKPKLNKTSATITAGKTVQLKVKGTKAKVKWSSNKKSVATVTKNGKVKGIKEGTATITAKVAGKKLKCKVTVSSTKGGSASEQFKTVELTSGNVNNYLEIVLNEGSNGTRLTIKDKLFSTGWYPMLDVTCFEVVIELTETEKNTGITQTVTKTIEVDPNGSSLPGYILMQACKYTNPRFVSAKGIIYYLNKSYIIRIEKLSGNRPLCNVYFGSPERRRLMLCDMEGIYC